LEVTNYKRMFDSDDENEGESSKKRKGWRLKTADHCAVDTLFSFYY
jgi:hypothetical protein